ncbi:MAG: biotin--[acetyl-CoA-carboxylase] ligase, partial [Candidatus Omnitrophica bacterium]|nr:biotin--[acetyl-CoA-carboxylase] ligase [Candidatus Omnitrophota bacterium]
KHIQELRQDGYEIEAVPHLGYRLTGAPDKLFPDEIKFGLDTKIIGKDIYHYEVASSTMDIAFKLALDSSCQGTVVCAESQHQGRGRLGRTWLSPKSKGIYLSIILRPPVTPNETSKLTLLAAVAVSEAIREVSGIDCQIKWPNDILVNEKKVGGILTELNAEMDKVKFVVLGIGLNVNTRKISLPAKSTSLKEEKKELISRVELTKEILRKIDMLYSLFLKEGFVPIIEKWRQLSSTLGQRVKVSSQNKVIEGEALDIDQDGGLLIRKDSGFIEKIYAGDLTRLR